MVSCLWSRSDLRTEKQSKQRRILAVLLFSLLLARQKPKPRIAAANEPWLAVNFRPKQRKQREIAIIYESSFALRRANGRTASINAVFGARRGPSPVSTGGTIVTPCRCTSSGRLGNAICTRLLTVDGVDIGIGAELE